VEEIKKRELQKWKNRKKGGNDALLIFNKEIGVNNEEKRGRKRGK
jgi:hypothetical protein